MTTALVTGANRGIGLELCLQLKGRGAQVIAACRRPSAELEGAGVRIEQGVDVTDRSSLDALRERLSTDGVRLDLLINNAGVLLGTSLEQWDVEAMRKQFLVNAVGPLDTTHALLPLLSRGAKVALITSRMGSIGDNDSGGSYGYRMSKAALNAGGKSLALDLRGRGIAVAILHPGYVRTDMTGHSGMIEPPEAARGLLARIDELSVDNAGRFLHQKGEELPW